MRQVILSIDEVLAGYDEVCRLYPFVPSLSHWRAWECAAYRHYRIDGDILDVGCGDGRYFRLIWPDARMVTGLDLDGEVVRLARASDIYRAVHQAPADDIPEPDARFDQVFANCSLEHMDRLDAVLREIARVLKPGGRLVCSVVTECFVQWLALPQMLTWSGQGAAGEASKRDFLEYHHLANPLSVDDWISRLKSTDILVEEHIPILPKFNSGAFLLMDNLWHTPLAQSGEFGDRIYPFLAANERFPRGFRSILAGLLEMETDWTDCSGAVFVARRLG